MIQATAGLKDSWASLVRQDCHWMWRHNSKLKELKDPLLDMTEWEMLMTSSPGPWKLYVGPMAQMIRDGKLIEFTERPSKTFDNEGYACLACNRFFTNAQGIIWHRTRHHKRRSAAIPYAGSSGRCRWCQACCPSRERLVKHLQQGIKRKGSGSCLGQLRLCGFAPYEAEEIDAFDEDTRARVKRLRRDGLHRDHADEKQLKGYGVRPEAVEGPLEMDMWD
eukprot:TRINITY_DN22454_c0_g2_i1.p1 TRINITY_DN22454_c0_g2~~TRINITY_DN22454_c0_g2_i1.p1  ORF type:complete len:221 (+),score=43.35 TRINITY_DN22454_c0_g2_i1:92-754(+)